MKIFSYTFFALAISFSMGPQAGGSPEDIEQLRNLLQPITSLSARFTQQITDANGFEIQRSEGSFQVAQPSRVRWIVEKPMPQQVVADGKTLWLYDPDLEQVVIQPFDANIEATPAMLFSGGLDRLDRLDSTYFIKQISEGSFQLTPEQGGSLFVEMQIAFDGKRPQSIGLTDGLGQITLITFADLELNPQIPAKQFEFQIPPGVDVTNNAN